MRVVPARGDLADVRLAERLFAPHYAAAIVRTARRSTPVFASVGGPQVSELLQGEEFEMLELTSDYAWGLGVIDGAVGFVAADALSASEPEPTQVVVARGAGAPIGVRLAGVGGLGLQPLDQPVDDYVAVAEAMAGTPYLAGGRSGAGIDAPGLIQLVLSFAGIAAPRFVDLQAEQLGHIVSDDAPMLRGDLLFAGERAAMALDEHRAVWADADAGDVVIGAIEAFGAVEARRRLP